MVLIGNKSLSGDHWKHRMTEIGRWVERCLLMGTFSSSSTRGPYSTGKAVLITSGSYRRERWTDGDFEPQSKRVDGKITLAMMSSKLTSQMRKPFRFVCFLWTVVFEYSTIPSANRIKYFIHFSCKQVLVK